MPEGYLDDLEMHSMKALLRPQVCCAARYLAAGLAVCRLCSLAGPLAQATLLLFCCQCCPA